MNYINGSVLILLSIIYFILFLKSYRNVQKEDCIIRHEQQIMSIKTGILATIPISLDAMFTALLTGYTVQSYSFMIIFYFFMTSISIYILNLIGLKLISHTKLNLGWLSSLVFLIIGVLKIFGI